jgi:hypothetical protein
LRVRPSKQGSAPRDQVNHFDAHKGSNNSAKSADHQIAAQQGIGTQRAIAKPGEVVDVRPLGSGLALAQPKTLVRAEQGEVNRNASLLVTVLRSQP